MRGVRFRRQKSTEVTIRTRLRPHFGQTEQRTGTGCTQVREEKPKTRMERMKHARFKTAI